MTAQTKLSPDGRVAVPKDVLERQGWTPETELEIEEIGGAVIIRGKRAAKPGEGIDWEEFRRLVPKHEGPPVTIEEMNEAIDRAMAERWKAKEARSR